jgi:hypothetical protein
VEEVRVTPAEVKLVVPLLSAHKYETVSTEPIELGVDGDSRPRRVGLALPEGVRMADGEPTAVNVEVVSAAKP